MWSCFLDFLFPRRSLTGREGAWVTEEERRGLRPCPVVLETADLRRLGVQYVDRVIAATDYRDHSLVQRAVRMLKYRRIRSVAPELGGLLLGAAPFLLLRDRPSVCPVPLHWRRRFARGFNQAELLARGFAERAGLEFAPVLRRTRWTGSQVGRGRDERLSAMADAFRAVGGAVPSSIILVDDLSTTGSTLDHCAKALKRAGCAFVQGLVVAHG
ncbi:MAG: hypothetical protein PHW10_01085 [Candidatus Peribacteraceae bacterium]|nr:hypothetical protein [Candidatus Peribacteraceae bacterium]